MQRVTGMAYEDAEQDANYILDFFGFDDEIIDNCIDPETRQVLYILEEEGLLSTRKEETTLYDGRNWRIHYWFWKKDKVFDAAKLTTM